MAESVRYHRDGTVSREVIELIEPVPVVAAPVDDEPAVRAPRRTTAKAKVD